MGKKKSKALTPAISTAPNHRTPREQIAFLTGKLEEAMLALRTKYAAALAVALKRAAPSESPEKVWGDFIKSKRSSLFPDPEPSDAEILVGYDWEQLTKYALLPWKVLRLVAAQVADEVAEAAHACQLDATPADWLADELRTNDSEAPAESFWARLPAVRVLLKQLLRATPEVERVGLDLVHDPACKSIRDILRAGPKMRGAVNKDSRLLCSQRQAGHLLNAMHEAGMVTQTKKRGAWRLVSDTPRQ